MRFFKKSNLDQLLVKRLLLFSKRSVTELAIAANLPMYIDRRNVLFSDDDVV